MINSRRASNALSGMTAHACDGCLGKRARWFCAADDAFLCQGCDASVHSANNLASRHERVRLQSSTSSPPSKIIITSNDEHSPPAWHGGFTRKARTPRSHNSSNSKPNSRKLVQELDVKERMFINNPMALVPEIGCEDDGNYMMGEFESEEQMICRVPVFDPFSNEDESNPRVVDVNYGKELLGTCGDELDLDVLPGFLPSDLDLAEFAADVENLLGLDHEEDYCNSDGAIQEMVCGDEVKVKDEVQEIVDEGFDEMSRSGSLILDWNLEVDGVVKEEGMKGSSSVSLRLNYDAVISAWDSQGSSPWTSGSRPDLNPHYLSHCSLGTCPKDGAPYGGGLGQVGGKGDGEREARVIRYKEKRRTRLFSKKIRYEVRKLNAEKRPRMRGRFVKRSFPNYLTTI